MKSTKKTIKYGRIEVPEGFDDVKNHKVRVTFWIDGDLLEELKRRSAEVGAGYQTFMHKMLRDAILEKPSLEQRVAKLESKMKKHG